MKTTEIYKVKYKTTDNKPSCEELYSTLDGAIATIEYDYEGMEVRFDYRDALVFVEDEHDMPLWSLGHRKNHMYSDRTYHPYVIEKVELYHVD
jgi:hypothetical protein